MEPTEASFTSEPLFMALYDELRRLAMAQLSAERPDHTLTPTALVHEAFLRLQGSPDLRFNDRPHFFAVAARAMRRVLVEHARARRSLKRGGGATLVVALPEHAITVDRTEDVLSIDQALGRLAAVDPNLVRIVEMKFFAGMTDGEIAVAMGFSDSYVRRQWRFARAWLRRAMDDGA
jgi:RNA polymerase sigma factor (TIGR02999 family)